MDIIIGIIVGATVFCLGVCFGRTVTPLRHDAPEKTAEERKLEEEREKRLKQWDNLMEYNGKAQQ